MKKDAEPPYVLHTYDLQNRLISRTNADGTTNYEYDAAGNLVKETSSDGSVSYTYNAQNRLVKGELSDGESSSYVYNALGVRIENEQVRKNKNAGNQNAALTDGSHGTDYLDFLRDGRADWQRAWESEVGTTHQNDFETVTRHYLVDYLSEANRDIMVTEDGSYITRYVYDENGKRISAEFGYADGTARGTTNANGEYGENLQSDFASELGKVWYRTSLLNSTLFAVDANGDVVAHMIYDAWGNPLVETYTDTNFSGLENLNNFTGYTWDETLGLYFAQNRFYDADTHRFTQEDVVKDGANWYVYCGNNPTVWVDPWGLNPTDDLLSLDWNNIGSITVDYVKYYSARDIFKALEKNNANQVQVVSTPGFLKTTAIFSVSYGKENITMTVNDQKSINTARGKTVTFTGHVSGSTSGDIKFYFQNGTNYVSDGTLKYYFHNVWCKTPTTSVYAATAYANDDPLTSAQKEANAKYIYEYLTKKGWTKQAVAGLLGNIYEESKMNPQVWQYKTHTGGYGLVQWDPATKFLNYEGLTVDGAASLAQNDPKKLIDEQLDYLIYSSLSTTDSSRREWFATSRYGSPKEMTYEEYIKSTSSAADLALVFHASYERSGDDEAARQERADSADYWYTVIG